MIIDLWGPGSVSPSDNDVTTSSLYVVPTRFFADEDERIDVEHDVHLAHQHLALDLNPLIGCIPANQKSTVRSTITCVHES